MIALRIRLGLFEEDRPVHWLCLSPYTPLNLLLDNSDREVVACHTEALEARQADNSSVLDDSGTL